MTGDGSNYGHRKPLQAPPPEAWKPLHQLAKAAGRPLERFLQIQAASGVLLLLAATAALALANSPFAPLYFETLETPLGIVVGEFSFERSVSWVINDGLMVIFFFVVGLEIRREIHAGELSEWRRAALPVAAAIGGMAAPALAYLWLAGGPETRSGWGVPMATDIAFAVGVVALLGSRVPAALRVLLLAVAVIDDLGAILVIAAFYSEGIALSGLVIAALGFVGVLFMQRTGVRVKMAYVLPSLVAWAGIYAAGVHPTIAGVIVGLLTPVRAWLGTEGFLSGVQKEVEHLTSLAKRREQALSSHELAGSLRHVDEVRREAMSPAESLIETLHPWVAFGIMPLFALANAGVSLEGGALDASAWTVAIAVSVGLVLGKPFGVFALSWLAMRLGLATLPAGLTLKHLLVLGVVAGIGFTMALFIAQLAFTDAALLSAAKLGILAASLVAGVVGLVLGRLTLPSNTRSDIAQTADEAEQSTDL